MNEDDNAPPLLEDFSDTICPWCFIGKRRLEAALDMLRSPITVRYRPFQLNPTLPAEGIPRQEYRTRKFGSWERSLELDSQVEAAGRECGLDFRHDLALVTPNTLASHVLIELAHDAGCQAQVVEAVFRAYFTEGRDIGSHDVLAEIGAACGLDAETVRAGVQDEALRAALHGASLGASRAGVASVPTFSLDGRTLGSGAQPPELLAHVLSSALRAARPGRTGSADPSGSTSRGSG